MSLPAQKKKKSLLPVHYLTEYVEGSGHVVATETSPNFSVCGCGNQQVFFPCLSFLISISICPQQNCSIFANIVSLIFGKLQGGCRQFSFTFPRLFAVNQPAAALLAICIFFSRHLKSLLVEVNRLECYHPQALYAMAPSGLFHRVFQWLANEVIVKGLANNAAFQRFAVRSSQHIQEAGRAAAEVARSFSENQSISQIRQETNALRKRASDFASALREELQQGISQQSANRIDRKPPKYPPSG